MKKIVCILTAILIAITFCGCDFADEGYPSPTERFFVNDFANVISDSAENEIYSKNTALYQKTTAQVTVITVDELNGESIEDYALNIGREWGVGDEEKNNGIVILLALNEREVYIAVGYGLEGAMPDSKTGRILDRYGVPYFSDDKFSDGLLAVNSAVINEVYLEYGLAADNEYIPIEQLPDEEEENEGSLGVLGSWIIMMVFVFIYLFVFRGRGFIFLGGPRPPFSSGSFRGGGGFGGFKGGGGSFGGGGAGRGF